MIFAAQLQEVWRNGRTIREWRVVWAGGSFGASNDDVARETARLMSELRAGECLPR